MHDERTAAELLRMAERIVEGEGLGSLSLRRLSDATGVSTRAVYSVFGSKDALVGALGVKAFEWLGDRVARAPFTDDPVADLVDAGSVGFRGLLVEHPVLFEIGVRTSWPATVGESISVAAAAAWLHLLARTDRLAARSLLGRRTSEEAAFEFHVMCEGLASVETRGLLPVMAVATDPEALWRRSLRDLIRGFSADQESVATVIAQPRVSNL